MELEVVPSGHLIICRVDIFPIEKFKPEVEGRPPSRES